MKRPGTRYSAALGELHDVYLVDDPTIQPTDKGSDVSENTMELLIDIVGSVHRGPWTLLNMNILPLKLNQDGKLKR